MNVFWLLAMIDRFDSLQMLGVVAAYFLGCFATGYYLYRWRTGQDIRQTGSGNAGAKNVGRALGKWGFLATFLGDFAKGILAVALARAAHFEEWAVILVMLAVVTGHNWPVQLRFQGGKGISTSMGAMLVYDLTLTGCVVAAFAVIWIGLRRFTLSGLLAYAVGPFLWACFTPPPPRLAGASLLAIEVLIAHHKNIREEFARLKPGPRI